ncbi:MAG: hypothetical protein HC904_02210 [Blastochloris sp.]|nr:hypothetical protein [Blastochloris sp.]
MTGRLPEIILLFISLFIQGLPFLLIGALASGFVSAFLPIQRFISWVPRHPLKAALAGTLAGLLIPSCECVGLPLVRRLCIKGLPLSAALAFLFAGASINPIALSSTWLAFSFEGPTQALLIRLGGAVLLVLALALLLQRLGPVRILRPELISGQANPNPANLVLPAPWLQTRHPRLAVMLNISFNDFCNVVLFYLFGSLLAASVQVFLTPLLGENLHGSWGIPFMMSSSILSSICSSADAFVAKSYPGVAPAAVFAFLWIGPVLDLKLLVVYRSFFQTRAIVFLATLSILLVFIMALLLDRVPPEWFLLIPW